MGVTPTPTQGTTAGTDPSAASDAVGTAPARGHIGRIVAGIADRRPRGARSSSSPARSRAAREHVITGSVLLTFAAAWALAVLSERWTDQPQRWAFVPAAFMALAGTAVLVVRTDRQRARMGVAAGRRSRSPSG